MRLAKRIARRLSMSALLAVLGVAWLPAGHAEDHAPSLRTSHPRHYGTGAGHVPGVTLPGQGMAQPRSRTPVLMRSDARLTDEWMFEKGLSRACNRGRFRQRKDRDYVVTIDGRTYGVAIGGRPGLYDPERLAAADAYYIVQGQGTSNCRVYRYRG